MNRSKSTSLLSRLSTAALTVALGLNLLTFGLNLSVVADAAVNGMDRLDFAAFWTAGRIVRDRSAPLYDLTTQRNYQQDLPSGRFYPFLNPPHVAPFFAALVFPYRTASRIWAAIQGVLMLLLGVSIWRATAGWEKHHRLLAISTVLGSAVVGYGVVNGSLSLLIAIALFQWFKCDQLRQDARAGLWLALATFKPQTIILIATSMLRRRSALIAFLAVCLGLSLLATAIFGLSVWSDYIAMSRIVQSSEAHNLIGTDKMPNLRSLLVLSGLSNSPAFMVAGAVLFAGMLLAFLWFKGGLLQVALTVSSGLFLSPYVNVYDLSILALPCILIYSESRSRSFAWLAVSFPLLMNLAFIMDDQGVLTVRLAQLFVLLIVCCSAYYSYKLRTSQSLTNVHRPAGLVEIGPVITKAKDVSPSRCS